MTEVEETGQLAHNTLQNHRPFAFIVDQLMAHIVQNRRFSLPATSLLRIACHYETQSLRSINKPDPLDLYLALVPGAKRITLRCLLESLPPPTLLLSNRFNGRCHEEAIDHIAASFSQQRRSRASHVYVPAVRVGHFLCCTPGYTIHDSLSAAIDSAKENRNCSDKERLKYFLANEMPADTQVIHLIFDAGSRWVHVRLGVDVADSEGQNGTKATDRGWIVVHDPFFEYGPAGLTTAQRRLSQELPLVAALVALTPGLKWPPIAWEKVEVDYVKCPQESRESDCGANSLHAMAREMLTGVLPSQGKHGCRLYMLECIMPDVPPLPRLMADEIASQKRDLDTELSAVAKAKHAGGAVTPSPKLQERQQSTEQSTLVRGKHAASSTLSASSQKWNSDPSSPLLQRKPLGPPSAVATSSVATEVLATKTALQGAHRR